MLGKMSRGSTQPSQSERSLEVTFRGVRYAICSPQQLEAISQITKLELINMGVPPELVDEKAKSLMDQRGITTMNVLLDRMTPEEKEEILYRYRYGGMWRSNP